MRTQALPKVCRPSGSASSSKAATSMATSFWFWFRFKVFIVMPYRSCPVRHPLAQQARGPQCQHDDEHDEGKNVGVVAAQHTAGQLADVAGADRLDQPQQNGAY